MKTNHCNHFKILQVVVDNTNPEKKDRAEYIKLAKKFRLPVRCFKMTVTHQHALHNNKVLVNYGISRFCKG